jgi:pSer/pThr/pTyr-binding forkhead associated (FHA) protein
MDEERPFLTDAAGGTHVLRDAVTTLGRAVENDVVIAAKRVSREHARLTRQGWRVVLEDLGSTNGTFLNGARVVAPVQLRDGDRIELGGVALTFHDPEVTFRESPLPALSVDRPAGVARVDRRPVELSPKEFALLVYLHGRRGKVCSKDEIGRAVWPEYADGDAVYDYQVENLVRRLRQKIEPDPSNPVLLLTVRGLGYKLLSVTSET